MLNLANKKNLARLKKPIALREAIAMARQTAITDIRRRNIRQLIDEWHGPTALARHLGLAGPSYLSQLVGGHRPITEKTARHLEKELALPVGWLDHEHARSHIDPALLATVLHAVAQVTNPWTLRPAQYAELVALTYDDATQRGHADGAFIRKLLRLIQ